MEEKKWYEIQEFIENTLQMTEQSLDSESRSAVKHYLDNNEQEMAFELLFLNLIKLNLTPHINPIKTKQIGLELGLDYESVFDISFWGKFENYLHKLS